MARIYWGMVFASVFFRWGKRGTEMLSSLLWQTCLHSKLFYITATKTGLECVPGARHHAHQCLVWTWLETCPGREALGKFLLHWTPVSFSFSGYLQEPSHFAFFLMIWKQVSVSKDFFSYMSVLFLFRWCALCAGWIVCKLIWPHYVENKHAVELLHYWLFRW